MPFSLTEPASSCSSGGSSRDSARGDARIVGIGSAFPQSYSQAELWNTFFADHYGNDAIASRIWHNCGVEQRHAAVDPRVEDLRFAGTEERMRRYLEAGRPLAVQAVKSCLADAELQASEIGHLTIVSCTGYGTPGIEVGLGQELGFDRRVQRLRVGDMGCYAAVPALAATADAAVARGKVGLVLCLELTSLHVQPPADDLAQVVAHALFSDAAVAVAVEPGEDRGVSAGASPDALSRGRASGAFEVVDVVSCTSAEHAPLMTWDVTNLGFRMGLSPKVARVLGQQVEPVIEDLLRPHGLTREEVQGWAVHPGGPAILEVIEKRLQLAPADLDESRAVLAEHGNCSSATVLLVLDRIRRQRDLEDGDPVVAMAFGPGLTLYATLLRLNRNTADQRASTDAGRRGALGAPGDLASAAFRDR